ncbi:MAG TPA: DUF2007 domain-containing protein [Gemmatimonadaceae bacterium]|nr:DUF2007 domain-containing protein [Gemmatimonadaceae bacterium]
MDGELVVLRTYSSEAEANLAATVLEANGIPARVFADTAGGAVPALAIVFPVRLIVRAADAELAREVLDVPVESEASDEGADADEA